MASSAKKTTIKKSVAGSENLFELKPTLGNSKESTGNFAPSLNTDDLQIKTGMQEIWGQNEMDIDQENIESIGRGLIYKQKTPLTESKSKKILH